MASIEPQPGPAIHETGCFKWHFISSHLSSDLIYPVRRAVEARKKVAISAAINLQRTLSMLDGGYISRDATLDDGAVVYDVLVA
jgi:hypothetical protein